MNFTVVLVVAALLIVGYAISLYNWFQTANMRIIASVQDIGNQLKRQASLIPNLESAAKGYLKHEKEIFADITSARKLVEKAVGSKDIGKIEKASDAISDLVPRLQVIVESNPEIKGEKVVSRLMDELRDTADKLMYARRVVIDLSADYNQRLVTFPSNVVANMFGFKIQQGLVTPTSGAHLEVSENETKDVKINI